MWIKERLTLTPAELAGIGVWLSLPWTVKMVFGQLVDSVPIFGSQRRSYILIGAALTACGLLTLAGAAGGWIAFARGRPPLHSRRHADRDRHRDPGRRCGRDVDRGRRPRRRGRQCRAPRTRSAPSSAWFRSSAALRWHRNSCGGRAFRMARRSSSPARPCFCSASSFPPISVLGRTADPVGIERAAAARLAHSRRRHRLRRCSSWRVALGGLPFAPGADLRPVDGW